MTYPKTYFSGTTEPERAATAFVIMPFVRKFDPIYAAVTKALQQPQVGFTSGRADHLFGGHEIMLDILRAISGAHLVIADLSGRNANVFYELGIAHMVKDDTRVLLLSQDIDDIHSTFARIDASSILQRRVGSGSSPKTLQAPLKQWPAVIFASLLLRTAPSILVLNFPLRIVAYTVCISLRPCLGAGLSNAMSES